MAYDSFLTPSQGILLPLKTQGTLLAGVSGLVPCSILRHGKTGTNENLEPHDSWKVRHSIPPQRPVAAISNERRKQKVLRIANL